VAIVASRWTLVRDEDGQPKSYRQYRHYRENSSKRSFRTQRLRALAHLLAALPTTSTLTPILAVAQLLQLKFPMPMGSQQMLEMLEINAKRGAAGQASSVVCTRTRR